MVVRSPARCGRSRTRIRVSIATTSPRMTSPATTRPMAAAALVSTLATAMAATPSPSTPSCSQGMPGPPLALPAPPSRNGAARLNSAAWAANSQNTSRQPPPSSTTPPNSGPSTVAIPQTKVTAANTRARWRSGNRSAMATMAKPEIQPLPSPWISRPTKNRPTSGAAALRMHPPTMINPAIAVALLRPNISDSRPELAPARMAPTK